MFVLCYSCITSLITEHMSLLLTKIASNLLPLVIKVFVAFQLFRFQTIQYYFLIQNAYDCVKKKVYVHCTINTWALLFSPCNVGRYYGLAIVVNPRPPQALAC